MRSLVVRATMLVVLVMSVVSSACGPPPSRLDHAFVIIMENTDYGNIIGSPDAPYINSLAQRYALATNYHGIGHNSLPNYLALTSGQSFSPETDGDCAPSGGGRCPSAPFRVADVSGTTHLAGKTWKGYMESMNGSCELNNDGSYAYRHNPFIYYADIQGQPACNQDVSTGPLGPDLSSTATTPNYAWITPNVCNDMHDCSTQTGDNWLKFVVAVIQNSPSWTQQRSAIFLVWDEDGSGTQNNHVACLVIGSPSSGIRAGGFQSSVFYNHYSLARTIDNGLGLAPLANDQNAASMGDITGF